jgi:alkylhydroperoxidase family enzyme
VLAAPHAVATRATSPRVRALAELATLVTEAPWSLSVAHHERARGAGLADDEVLHAVALSAYFGHLNRIADAVGVPLDYAVERIAPPAEPATPPLFAAPAALHRDASLRAPRLAARPATAAAVDAWRRYVMDRNAPLPRETRLAVARWVAALLGDGLTEMATAADVADAELRALVTAVTLAPWQLAAAAYAPLRARGMDDAALFDVVVIASTAGVTSRIAVALAALGR